MPRNCVLLAYRPALDTLEFSNMAITVGFLEFIPDTRGIIATTLRFNNYWAPAKAVERIVKAFEILITFEYSLNATLSEAQSYWLRRWQLGQFVSALRQHKQTLKHLKIVRLEPFPDLGDNECNHIGSLADFTALECLSVSKRFVTPHTLSLIHI